MDLKKYENKKILILGLGQEGYSTFKLLRKTFPDKTISLADQKEFDLLEEDFKNVVSKDKNIQLYLGSDYQKDINSYDLIFKSPGVIVSEQVALGKVTSQAELFFTAHRDKIIGVTGTKGKSTTATLIYKILEAAGINTELIGNIGKPPFDSVGKKPNTIYVYELSSYQLEQLNQSPHIAVFLNLFKEHLDYHKSFENYIAAKLNIFKWQKSKDFLVFSEDFDHVEELARACPATKLTFSLKKKTSSAYTSDGIIYFEKRKIMDTVDIKLQGEFNLNNVLAAIIVAKLFRAPNDKIVAALKSFNPLKHRLENVGTYKGITFYNDSISTVPEATMAALEALSPKVSTLIVGGFNRGIDFSGLAEKIAKQKIENIILFPETGEKIKRELVEYKVSCKYFNVDNMKDAVKVAFRVTKPETICLMSPASPSYNLFKNFEDRGDQYVDQIKKFK